MPPLLDRPSPVALVAVAPDQPGNLGALIRITACFAAPLHVVEPCGFPFSPKAWARSAMDYARLADLVRHDGWAAFRASWSGRMVALTAHGETALWDTRFAPGDALLLGSESTGLSEPIRAGAALRVRIPIAPQARSLNIAVAGAVALAEAQRQLLWC
ncbi:MAG: TrmH family RNA methyltransferase [Pikeienuella sp.]